MPECGNSVDHGIPKCRFKCFKHVLLEKGCLAEGSGGSFPMAPPLWTVRKQQRIRPGCSGNSRRRHGIPIELAFAITGRSQNRANHSRIARHKHKGVLYGSERRVYPQIKGKVGSPSPDFKAVRPIIATKRKGFFSKGLCGSFPHKQWYQLLSNFMVSEGKLNLIR